MALRKKAMAIVLSMAMVATSLSLPNMTAKTAQASSTETLAISVPSTGRPRKWWRNHTLRLFRRYCYHLEASSRRYPGPGW